jgi:hypothetical protein
MKKVVAQDMAMNGNVEAEKEALKRAGFGTKGISKATKVNDKAEDVFAQYAKAAGIEGATLTNTTGNDKNRQFVYTDKDGNEVTVDLNSMIDAVAEYNATENANARATNIANIYGSLNKSQMAELGAAVNNDYSKLNAS